MGGIPQGARKAVRLCPGMVGSYLLLGSCSCIALISYIHVTMQYLHFHHPWWSYSARSQESDVNMASVYFYQTGKSVALFYKAKK